jgi:steroid delta-isomerase-like uncharacterized protein
VDPENLFKKYQEAFDRQDLDALSKLYAPDVLHIHPFPEPLKGRDAVKKEQEDFLKAIPDIKFKISNIIIQGNNVAAEFVLTGTNTGPFVTQMGTTPPTNRRVEGRNAGFWRINAEGLIAEEHIYFDTGSLFRQLGLKLPA